MLDRSGRIIQTRRLGDPVSFDTTSYRFHNFISTANRDDFGGMVRAAIDFGHAPSLTCNFNFGTSVFNQRFDFWPYAGGRMVVICKRIF